MSLIGKISSKVLLILFVGFITTIASKSDWREIELYAERYPYVAALLKKSKMFICSGAIINKNTVLTSGSCVHSGPHYIVVGLAVLRKEMDTHLIKVTSTEKHAEYEYKFNEDNVNYTRIHSDIGLVFANRPILVFYDNANLRYTFSSELEGSNLIVVGYGKLRDTNIIALHKQKYRQTSCLNHLWYYCVCGFKHLAFKGMNFEEFGKGAPVLYGTRVVGVTSTTAGAMKVSSADVHYNVFTVMGPYESWLKEVNKNDTTLTIRTRLVSGGVQLEALLKLTFKLLAATFYVALNI